MLYGTLPIISAFSCKASQSSRVADVLNQRNCSMYIPSNTTCFSDTGMTVQATQDGTVAAIADSIGTKHLIQSTVSSRPILRKGAKNLLENTSILSTQTESVTEGNYTLHFKGTGTVTLSGVSTAGPLVGIDSSTRVSLTFKPSTAGTLTLTVSGTVTEAMLEIGSTVSTYIENLGTNLSNGIGNWWLDFDGSNDFLNYASSSPFQFSDKHFNVSCWIPLDAGANPVSSVSGTTAVLAQLRSTSSGYSYAAWRDDSSTQVSRTSSVNRINTRVIASSVKLIENTVPIGILREDGNQVSSPIYLSDTTYTVTGVTLGKIDTSYAKMAFYGAIFGSGEINIDDVLTLEKYFASMFGGTL